MYYLTIKSLQDLTMFYYHQTFSFRAWAFRQDVCFSISHRLMELNVGGIDIVRSHPFFIFPYTQKFVEKLSGALRRQESLQTMVWTCLEWRTLPMGHVWSISSVSKTCRRVSCNLFHSTIETLYAISTRALYAFSFDSLLVNHYLYFDNLIITT